MKDATSRVNDLEIKINSVINHEELLKSKVDGFEGKLSMCAQVGDSRDAFKQLKTDFMDKINTLREDVLKLENTKADSEQVKHILSQKADASLVEQHLDKKLNKSEFTSVQEIIRKLETDKLDHEKWEINNK